SPWVRFFRCLSSSFWGPPGPKRSWYFRTSRRLAPKVWRLPMMLLLKPVTMATIAITVVTPTTMPSTVSVDRSLCSRMDPAAKRTLPAKPRTNGAQPRSVPREARGSLIAQRLHRRESRRGRRRRQAGQHPRDGRGEDPDQDEPGLHRGGKDLAHGQRDQRAS